MKITKMLPKTLAIEYQKYDLDKISSKLKHYKQFVRVLEQMYQDRYQELEKLQSQI